MVTVMQTARRLGMTNGDYVFIYYARHVEEGIPIDIWAYDEDGFRMSEQETERQRIAFYPLKLVI